MVMDEQVYFKTTTRWCVYEERKGIKGIVEGDAVPDLFIPTLIELYRQGKFPYDKLIKVYPFDQINQAVEDMEKGIVIKPVLKF